MRDSKKGGNNFGNQQRPSLDQLIDTGKRLQQGCRYSEGDHLAFMTLCFLSKQLDHAKSVRILVRSTDAILVYRSIIEGLCQLAWAAWKPQERPLL